MRQGHAGQDGEISETVILVAVEVSPRPLDVFLANRDGDIYQWTRKWFEGISTQDLNGFCFFKNVPFDAKENWLRFVAYSDS